MTNHDGLSAGFLVVLLFMVIVLALSGCSAGTHVSGPLGTIETGVSVSSRPSQE